jgi:hypothetical protein
MRRGILAVVAVAAASLAACSDPSTIGDQLVGTWVLAAYDDHGATATTTGTWTFSADATFAVLGTITFPGEPTDSLDVTGTWMEQGTSSIAVTVAGETDIWDVTLASDTAVLVLPDESGELRITLAK